MIIEINVDSLISSKLNASQYVILHLLYEKRYNTLETYYQTFFGEDHLTESTFTWDIEDLHNKKYVLKWNEEKLKDFPLQGIRDIVLNNAEVKKLFGIQDSYFWELFSTYPIKVVNKTGGARSLRPLSLTAKETLTCKKKYENYLGKRTAKNRHEHVMKCLKAELFSRVKGGSMAFMHELLTYINKQAWSKYEYLLELSNQTSKAQKYGEELI
tara:strand:- start:15653 stop:16291 length:639 start_codon:yes stop_codon:yes gene_type:complete